MKRYLILLFVTTFSLSSCLKSADDPYELAQEQLTKDEALIVSFLNQNSITATRHDSGLYYKIIAPGSGNYNYATGSPTITVKYTGKLLNGNVFDSSNSFKYPLANLIAGWKLGIPYIQKGGKIRLFIPSGYGYGSVSQPKIPANSVLDFEIELLDIE